MKITVKKLKKIDIEVLLNRYNIEVTIEEQQPHGARTIPYRIFLSKATYRDPRSANFSVMSHGCFDPEDEGAVLVGLKDMLNWKVIRLPCGKEIGPYVVTCKHEED